MFESEKVRRHDKFNSEKNYPSFHCVDPDDERSMRQIAMCRYDVLDKLKNQQQKPLSEKVSIQFKKKKGELGGLWKNIAEIKSFLWVVRLGYCFTPYQRPCLYNGAPLVAFYDTLGIRRMYSLVELNWLFNVTIKYISVIYVTAQRCAGGLKKVDLRPFDYTAFAVSGKVGIP